MGAMMARKITVLSLGFLNIMNKYKKTPQKRGLLV